MKRHLPTIAGMLLGLMLDAIVVLALYLLWVGRKQFAGLLNQSHKVL